MHRKALPSWHDCFIPKDSYNAPSKKFRHLPPKLDDLFTTTIFVESVFEIIPEISEEPENITEKRTAAVLEGTRIDSTRGKEIAWKMSRLTIMIVTETGVSTQEPVGYYCAQNARHVSFSSVPNLAFHVGSGLAARSRCFRFKFVAMTRQT